MKQTGTADGELSTILEIWRATLGVGAVQADSNFFALGGDSVMVMAMLLRIDEAYGVFLDPTEIYDAPTPAQLAQRLPLLRAQPALP